MAREGKSPPAGTAMAVPVSPMETTDDSCVLAALTDRAIGRSVRAHTGRVHLVPVEPAALAGADRRAAPPEASGSEKRSRSGPCFET